MKRVDPNTQPNPQEQTVKPRPSVSFVAPSSRASSKTPSSIGATPEIPGHEKFHEAMQTSILETKEGLEQKIIDTQCKIQTTTAEIVKKISAHQKKISQLLKAFSQKVTPSQENPSPLSQLLRAKPCFWDQTFLAIKRDLLKEITQNNYAINRTVLSEFLKELQTTTTTFAEDVSRLLNTDISQETAALKEGVEEALNTFSQKTTGANETFVQNQSLFYGNQSVVAGEEASYKERFEFVQRLFKSTKLPKKDATEKELLEFIRSTMKGLKRALKSPSDTASIASTTMQSTA